MSSEDFDDSPPESDIELLAAKQVTTLPNTIDLAPGLMRDGKLYPVTHFLYFPQEAKAREAAAEMAAQDRLVEISYTEYSSQWLVQIIELMTTEVEMYPIWQQLSAFAERFGGEYDGWETAIKMDDVDPAILCEMHLFDDDESQ